MGTKMRALVAATSAALLLSISVSASGPIGIYAIIERVTFEPDEAKPERIHIWGAFALVDQTPPISLTTSKAARGHLYFSLPLQPTPQETLQVIRREWADLKALAGTGQAVGFGTWRYVGRVDTSEDSTSTTSPLRVLLPSEPAGRPMLYQTESGLIRLNAQGSYAAIVSQLQDALRK